MLAHFLGTGLGSLVLVLAASALLALVVWFAVAVVVALLARLVLLFEARTRRRHG